MKTWISLLTNPEKISAIFLDDLPQLLNVDLHEISLNRESSAVNLRFDLVEYPKLPPKKWKDVGYNRVQIIMSFSGVYELDLSGWSANCRLDLSLSGQNGSIKLLTSGSKVKLELASEFVSIASITAYRNS